MSDCLYDHVQETLIELEKDCHLLYTHDKTNNDLMSFEEIMESLKAVREHLREAKSRQDVRKRHYRKSLELRTP